MFFIFELFLGKIHKSISELGKLKSVEFEPNNLTVYLLLKLVLIKFFIVLIISFIISFSSIFGLTYS